jgi:hypothetical protein
MASKSSAQTSCTTSFQIILFFGNPYFDDKLTITIVWTELFGAMKAPRNRPHEPDSDKPKKNIFKFVFLSIYGQNHLF